MALLPTDLAPPSDSKIREHFTVATEIYDGILTQISSLRPDQLAFKREFNRRSLNETLEHLGNCVWWYCSRVDDSLPEWPCDMTNLAGRVSEYLRRAEEFCLGVSLQVRGQVKIPTRYLTADACERWTLGKVIRRQAEHLWEHLSFIGRDIAAVL